MYFRGITYDHAHPSLVRLFFISFFFLPVRKLTVGKGSITTAHGSAVVRLGNTSVVAGVSLETGPMKPSLPTSSTCVAVSDQLVVFPV